MRIFIIIFSLLLPYFAAAEVIKSDKNCIKSPSFPKEFGFDLNRSALSTTELYTRGLTLVDVATNPKKTYRHPTWQIAGYLGGMTFDDKGAVYTFPVPHVELTYNNPAKQNIIYKVDSDSGVMSKWVELPIAGNNFNENVFGILGITFSCATQSIYVSSVMGSSKNKETGKIYQLSAKTGAILSVLDNIDGFGLATAELNGKQVLLIGRARNSDLYGVDLNNKGSFIGRPYQIGTIVERGPRGDDKIKKIVVNEETQSLQITGFEFNFNLSSGLEKQESSYEIPIDKLLKF